MPEPRSVMDPLPKPEVPPRPVNNQLRNPVRSGKPPALQPEDEPEPRLIPHPEDPVKRTPPNEDKPSNPPAPDNQDPRTPSTKPKPGK